MVTPAEQIWLWRQSLRPENRFGTPYAREQFNPPKPKNLWQKLTPWKEEQGETFGQVWEKPFKAFGALVTDPFTPSVPGTEGMPWLQRAEKEYELWQEPTWTTPWGAQFRPTKGIVESLPFFAPGAALGTAGKLASIAAKGGALGKAATVARAGISPLATVGKAEQAMYGLAGRGLKAAGLGLAGKVAGRGLVGGKGALKVPERGVPSASPLEVTSKLTEKGNLREIRLPSDGELNRRFGADAAKALALSVERIPVLSSIVRAIGGRAAFAKETINPPKPLNQAALLDPKSRHQYKEQLKKYYAEVVTQELVKRDMLLDMRYSLEALVEPIMLKYGSPTKLLKIDEKGLVGVVKGTVKRKPYLYDVLEHPKWFDWSKSPRLAREYVDELRGIVNVVAKLRKVEKVRGFKKEGTMFHRHTLGWWDEWWDYVKADGSYYNQPRTYKTHQQGVEGVIDSTGSTIHPGRVDYLLDPNQSVKDIITMSMRDIADRRFSVNIKNRLGGTVEQRLGAELLESKIAAQTRHETAKLATEVLAITRLKKPHWTKLKKLHEGGGWGKQFVAELEPLLIKQMLPDEFLENYRTLLSETITRPDKMEKFSDVLKQAHVNRVRYAEGNIEKPMAQLLKPKPLGVVGPQSSVKIADARQAMKEVGMAEEGIEKLLNEMYISSYKATGQARKDSLRRLKDIVKVEADTAAAELKSTKAGYAAKRKALLSGRNELAPFTVGVPKGLLSQGPKGIFPKGPPIFPKGKPIFPKEVVKRVEIALRDKGNRWLKAASATSGTMRLLVAAMDFSAPFIQGLPVLGRRPDVWAKATINHYGYFLKPEKLYQYLSKPAVLAIREERMLHGSSMGSFEYFKALPDVQKWTTSAAGKLKGPTRGVSEKVGKGIVKGIEQTYGRAEAAFTGFGEVARNEMWKALKRDSMSPKRLDELAAVVDRMTGVMSSQALGVGLSQSQFESAFAFFAPRYTRAGLSLFSSMFRGGYTGAEARKALGGMMAGGAAMYYGVATALGQEPDFDPTSSGFMTIKIGNDRVGVGGIFTALARFGADVVATTAQNPSDLFWPYEDKKLNRWDNPFVRFLYSRTSPLTGAFVGAVVERADYFGKPIEEPSEWARFLAEKATPIAFQRAYTPSELSPAGLAGEIMGLRTFPQKPVVTPVQKRRAAYEKIEDTVWGRYSPELRRLADKIRKLELDDSQEAKVLLLQNPGILFVRREIARQKAHWKRLNRRLFM